ncbi:hypothetical protein BH23ACT6_BH23ACT6_18200 [soil metagenome]
MSTTDDSAHGASGTKDQPSDAPPVSKPAARKPPASAGFGLVFQAPDLSDVPVRKPKPKPKAKAPDQDSGSESGSSDHSGGSAASSTAGGRGSMGHAGGDSTQGSGEAGAAQGSGSGRLSAPTSDDASGAEAGDASGTGESEREGSAGNRRRKRGGKGRRGRGKGGDGNGGDGNGGDGSGSGPAQDGEEPGQDSEQNAGEDASDLGKQNGAGERSASGKKKGGGKQGSKSGGGSGTKSADRSAAGTSSDQGNEERGGEADGSDEEGGKRRRRRRRSDSPERGGRDEVTAVRGSTRLEAKRQRRNQGREVGRRRTVISEAEFLARRESVERVMVVRGLPERTQIAVLEDGVPVEHYVSQQSQSTTVGNVYLGRVQNVLPSMEAAFVDIGKGRNAVLYAGEVNWDAAGLEVNQARRIENALASGQSVLVQVTKDPIGHKGARLTSQVSLPGRFLVYVPGSSMTGISRKLPDTERTRLKKILKEVVPPDAGVIVRTAAEGASEAELRADVERLKAMWEGIQAKSASKSKTASGPVLLHSEPDMTVRVIRDVFNEDFAKLIVSGDQAWKDVSDYLAQVAPELAVRAEKWTGKEDIFTPHRVNEALSKAMDRKVWLPSGGSLVIDRTEAMTVVDVNTGKFVGSGGNLEETVTKNNIEAAEEIVRQLRLRDIGGIIVIDFIDMVLESNRELVVRRLLECLGRDRTKHQVAEVTSLGLVQMTRKRVGAGLIEVFSEPCVHCHGRGLVVHAEPVEKSTESNSSGRGRSSRTSQGSNGGEQSKGNGNSEVRSIVPSKASTGPTPAQIAAAAHAAAVQAGTAEDVALAAAAAASDATQLADTSELADHGELPGTAAVVSESDPSGMTHSAEWSVSSAEVQPSAVGYADSGASEVRPAGVEPAEVQPVEAPRPRRRRGRVVAPAGPPSEAPIQAE